MSAIRSIGLCLKEVQPPAPATVVELIRWLRARDVAVDMDEITAAALGSMGAEAGAVGPHSRAELAARVDRIVVLGGDGTLLSVARDVGTQVVPILGVNLGRLGFLTELNFNELFPALEKLLVGELAVVPRMRLEVEARREGRVLGRFQALNDAVISKTALSRMIDLVAFVDGVEVTTYHADGLIVSTPTGSTAYSLSAGGPLLAPDLEAFVLTPISPHSLTQRPLVLPESVAIEILVEEPSGEVALTMDGQAGLDLLPGDRVKIRKSEHPVAIVASPFRNRYEILHEKLRWGER
jgi:NAD+ kinase